MNTKDTSLVDGIKQLLDGFRSAGNKTRENLQSFRESTVQRHEKHVGHCQKMLNDFQTLSQLSNEHVKEVSRSELGFSLMIRNRNR